MFRHLPIGIRLTAIMMLITLVCLALSNAAYISRDRLTFKNKMSKEMAVLAEVIANRSTAALAFGDSRLALENLQALAAHPSINYACLVDLQGDLLAEYAPEPGVKPARSAMNEVGAEFSDDFFTIVQPVLLDGSTVGTLFIRTGLQELTGLMRQQILIGIGVFLFVGILAFIMASQLQKSISVPVVNLVHTMNRVAELNDFSVRVADPGRNDELGSLVSGFNDMLENIENSNEVLHQQEIRFRQMIELSPEPMLLLDGDEKIVYLNQKFVELFGYSKTDLPDVQSWWPQAYPDAQYRGEVQQEWYRRTESALASGAEIEPQEAVVRCKDGTDRHILFRGAPLGDQFLVLFSDLTERVLAEKQKLESAERLRQAQKMEAVGTLAGGIAHDFNNILAAIFGYTELARQDLPLDSPAHADLAGVIQASSRARDLVQQILTFSRSQSQIRQKVSIAESVTEALNLIRAAAPATITIEKNITPGVSPVLADPTSLHQVVMNLCTNAYQAMEAQGGILRVFVSEVEFSRAKQSLGLTTEPGTFVSLEISDTGPGMEMAQAERIFEPYFTTKGVGKGTGIGLAVVHGIVGDLGGLIELKSRPGEGTSFRIFIPADRNESKAKPSLYLEADRRGNERVLVVDDEAALVEVATRSLVRLGYAVTSALGSTEAWRVFSADPEAFDLIISDQTMPGLTGIELSKKVLALRPGMPIILCSGYNFEHSTTDIEAIGIRAMVAKPLSPSAIANVVREVLDAEELV